MSDTNFISLVRAGNRCCCPRGDEARLLRNFLGLATTCETCDLDIGLDESVGGPAVFSMHILGAIVAGLALTVEVTYQPPIWVHIVLWLPLTIVGALAMVRPFKALMIALQLKNAATQEIEVN